MIVGVLRRLGRVIGEPVLTDIGDVNGRPSRPQAGKESAESRGGFAHVFEDVQSPSAGARRDALSRRNFPHVPPM